MRVLLPIVVFVVVSIALCLGWMRVADPYGHLLAEPLAHVLQWVSPDVIDVDHDPSGQPFIVLANNDRKPMPRIVRSGAGFTLPVFVSLVVAAFVAPRVRWRLTGRAGAIRIGAGLAVMIIWNGILTVLVGSYAVAAANRGAVPAGLRLAGSFGDIVQVFVPFVVFVVFFVRGRLPASG